MPCINGFSALVNIDANAFAAPLDVAGSKDADRIIGGRSDDRIATGGGLDSLYGGEGRNTFIIGGAAVTDATNQIVIYDWKTGDVLEIASQVGTSGSPLNGTPVFNEVPVDVSGAASLVDALSLAAQSQTASVNSVIRWFNYGGNTYVVVDNSDTTGLQPEDGVIKLIGTHVIPRAGIIFAANDVR
ncbi:MAG: hypothetical protein FGM35_00680 [Rhodocyclaceae bacterium]|nr:hypothetical protein [Rhodocyclaceae bacterium]